MSRFAERVEPVDRMRLLSAIPVGVAHISCERLTYVNPALLSLLRQTEEGMLGQPFVLFVDEQDREAVEARYWARVRGDRAAPPSYEANLRRGDGTLVRVELEPRAVGEREIVVLVRDLGDRIQDSALLAALSALALRVQRARTPEEVFRGAGEGMRDLGMSMAALRLEGEEVVVAHVAADASGLRAAQALFGPRWEDWRFRTADLQESTRALAERRNVFHEAVPELLVDAARRGGRPGSAEARELLVDSGLGKGVFCPLVVRGEPWGLLAVGSDALSSRDAAAIGLFASKVASALEVATTIAVLERRNRELASIQDVANAGSETELEALVPRLLRIACSALACETGAFYLLDAKRAEFVLAAVQGGRGHASRKYRVVQVGSPVGKLALSLEPRVLRPGQMPGDFARDLAVESIGELLVVPLHIKGRLAGTLNLGRAPGSAFSAEELPFAAQLGAQIAIQVENARLYAETSRSVKLLTVLFALSRMGSEALEVAPLVERVLAKIAEAIPVEGAALYLLDGDRLALAGMYGNEAHWRDIAQLPLDHQTLCARAALERRTQVVDLASWPERGVELARRNRMMHAVSVPLIATERLIGTLCVVRRADRVFAEEEVGLLESSAAQVAVAIERARLFEQERKRVEELQLFLEIGRVITASLDLEHILESSAASMARMAEASHAFIVLQEPNRRVLRGVATSAPEHRDHFRTVCIPLDGSSASVLAVRTRGPVRVENALESGMVLRELVEHYGQKSVLALPLLVRGEPIGAVVISDSRGPRAWTDAHIDRAMAVARQVAVAVANARLYEDLKRSYDQLARAQEALVKRERLAALGELSAVVAHEVRNPLGVIFNSLGSLRRVLKPSGDAAMLLDIVGEEADRLNRIVGELLDFARPSEPELQPESITDQMHRAAEGAFALAQTSGVAIEIEPDESVPKVPVDAHMLRQALLNLVINAVQATPRGGRVVLSSALEEREGRRLARVEVADTGGGIPPDIAERVFQPFFTTKASGTGLGLAVVKRIVEAHRGELALESNAGAGARFILRLPLEQRR